MSLYFSTTWTSLQKEYPISASSSEHSYSSEQQPPYCQPIASTSASLSQYDRQAVQPCPAAIAADWDSPAHYSSTLFTRTKERANSPLPMTTVSEIPDNLAPDPQLALHSPYPSPPSTSACPRKPIPLPSMSEPEWLPQRHARPPLSPPPTSPLPTCSLPDDIADTPAEHLPPLSTDLEAHAPGVPQLLTPESPPWPEPLPSIAEEEAWAASPVSFDPQAHEPAPQPPWRDYAPVSPFPLSSKLADNEPIRVRLPYTDSWPPPLVTQVSHPPQWEGTSLTSHWSPDSPDEPCTSGLSRAPTLEWLDPQWDSATRSSTLESVALATPESHTSELPPLGPDLLPTPELHMLDLHMVDSKARPQMSAMDLDDDDDDDEGGLLSCSPRMKLSALPELDDQDHDPPYVATLSDTRDPLHEFGRPSPPSSPSRRGSIDLPDLDDHATFAPTVSPSLSMFDVRSSDEPSMQYSPPLSPARRGSIDLPDFGNAPMQYSPPLMSMDQDMDTSDVPTERWSISPPPTSEASPSPSRRTSIELATFDEAPLAAGSPQLPDLDLVLTEEPENMASPSSGALLDLPDTDAHPEDIRVPTPPPHGKQPWQTPHPLMAELPQTPAGSGLLFDMPADAPDAGVPAAPDEDPLLQDLDVPPGALADAHTELGRLWALRRRSLSAERAAREVEAQLAARVGVLEAALLNPGAAGPPPPPSALLASALTLGETVPAESGPRAELATLAGVRAEAKRLRKREKERAREVGALLRLKLGAHEAVGGAGAAKGPTRNPRQLAAKMVFHRHEASAKPLVGRPRATVAQSPLSTVLRIGEGEEEDADVDTMLI